MNLLGRALSVLILMFVSTNAFANGGLPIIFLANTYAFVIGGILILVIEIGYLRRVFPQTPIKEIAYCVLKLNFWSTMAGIVVIPILILIFQLDPIYFLVDSKTTKSTMTLVWWASFSLDLLLAYIATVFIEFKILKRSSFAASCNSKVLLRHVWTFNLLSYIVLVLIVAITMWVLIE